MTMIINLCIFFLVVCLDRVYGPGLIPRTGHQWKPFTQHDLQHHSWLPAEHSPVLIPPFLMLHPPPPIPLSYHFFSSRHHHPPRSRSRELRACVHFGYTAWHQTLGAFGVQPPSHARTLRHWPSLTSLSLSAPTDSSDVTPVGKVRPAH